MYLRILNEEENGGWRGSWKGAATGAGIGSAIGTAIGTGIGHLTGHTGLGATLGAAAGAGLGGLVGGTKLSIEDWVARRFKIDEETEGNDYTLIKKVDEVNKEFLENHINKLKDIYKSKFIFVYHITKDVQFKEQLGNKILTMDVITKYGKVKKCEEKDLNYLITLIIDQNKSYKFLFPIIKYNTITKDAQSIIKKEIGDI